jgi:hypothetical protein
MPKQLVISPTQINYGDDRGGVHHDAGDIVDVSKDIGIALMRANRTLYINKADDPDKSGRNTASKEMLAAVEDMAKAKGKQKSAD